MRKFKLTDQNMQTHNGYQWELGVWREAEGDPKQNLCSDGWLHCYDSPLLAVLHNPIHAGIENPRLFEVEVDGETKNDWGLKCGYRSMRLTRELNLPHVTTEQRIRYAIFCALSVCDDPAFIQWAEDWLSGKNRSAEAAEAAAWAARAAAEAATRAAAAEAAAEAGWAARAAAEAAEAARIAAEAAAWAAEAAAWAATRAAVAEAAAEAAWAARAATEAAKAARIAAEAAWAARAAASIDLQTLAEKAVSE